jgi:rhodanese-related sulfurtransferase
MKPVRLAVLTLAAAAVLGVGLTGCANDATATAVGPVAEAPAGQPPYGRVDVAQFASLIAEPGVQIIDVRTPQEYADGHIRGAVNIPVQQSDYAERVAQLDPAGTYAVYCRSSARSKGAVAEMKNAGLPNVYELTGGTVAWTADGQALTR